MRPDLAESAQRAAYRNELRALHTGPRLIGFLLVALGAAGLVYTNLAATEAGTLRLASWLLLAAGWAVLIAVIVLRTRHHRRRMAGD